MASKMIGNQFWKLASKYGRDKLFGDPAILMEEARAYFDWCDQNPLKRVELVKYMGDAKEVEVPLGRPYTIDGLTIFLGVSGSYFRTAKGALKDKIERGKADKSEVELLDTIERIEAICRNQNVEGASVGLFSSNLVARLHSIAETVNSHNTGDTVVRVSVRDQATADYLAQLDDLL